MALGLWAGDFRKSFLIFSEKYYYNLQVMPKTYDKHD